MTTRRTTGFTLVELITAVAILFMLVGVAIPTFSSILADWRLTRAVDRVAADLRYVQSQAVTRGGLFRFHHGDDVGQPGKYRLEQSTDGGVSWVAMPDQSEWTALSDVYQGSSLQSFKDNDGAGASRHWVAFNSQGAADTTGVSAAFVYPLRVTVVAQSGATRDIRVVRTGAVRVQ